MSSNLIKLQETPQFITVKRTRTVRAQLFLSAVEKSLNTQRKEGNGVEGFSGGHCLEWPGSLEIHP